MPRNGVMNINMNVDAELAALGVRLGRMAESLPKAVDPALRIKITADLGELRRQIESFLRRFGTRLDDHSRTSLVLARQEIANTVHLLAARTIGRA
jgi:hypothetical protein